MRGDQHGERMSGIAMGSGIRSGMGMRACRGSGQECEGTSQGQAGHAGGSVTLVRGEDLPGEGHLCARTPVRVSRPLSPPRPQPGGGRARRAGDSRTLDRAGASRPPSPSLSPPRPHGLRGLTGHLHAAGAGGAELRNPRNRGQGCHRGGWRLRQDVTAAGLRQG